MSSAILKPVKIGGKTYQLAFKFGTIRNAERAAGVTMTALMADPKLAGMDVIGAIFFATLQPNHPMTPEDADVLLDHAGAIEAVIPAIRDGLAAFFKRGKGKAGEEGNG